MKLRKLCAAAFAALALISVGPAEAQFNLGRLGVPNLLGDRQPITTSLPDARWGDASKDGFTPREPMRSLMTLQRTPNGGFVLQPGHYQFHDQSYCLKAGTHGPGGGDGYLYAPPKGPAEDAVMTILRNSVNHPEIQQHDIQLLLWAIIARAKFEDLSPELKATAARLLTPRQLAALNRSALDVAGSLANHLGGVPEPLRQIAQAEQQMRQMLTRARASPTWSGSRSSPARRRWGRAARTFRAAAGASTRTAITSAICRRATATRWWRSGCPRAARRSARNMTRRPISRCQATPPASASPSRADPISSAERRRQAQSDGPAGPSGVITQARQTGSALGSSLAQRISAISWSRALIAARSFFPGRARRRKKP